MKETKTSEYDGRLKYYNIYEDVQNKYSEALLNNDYEGMFRCLLLDLNQVCMFWPGGIKDMRERIRSMQELKEEIERLTMYDSEGSERLAKNKINSFVFECMSMENEIQLIRARHRLLFPMSIDKEPETEEDYADLYESETFGSITSGNKSLESYEQYSLDYGRVDEKTKAILKRQRWLNENKDADGFYLIAGYNNTGKSTLSHHLHTLWTEGDPTADYCSFDPEQFAHVLGDAMNEKLVKQRVAHWDEANFTGRGAMTKYNRDVIDLYWSNRSEHGLHLWCNPSIEYMEKVLVKERVSGIFLIHRGESGKPPKRRFTFITRAQLQQLWREKKTITLDILEKEARKYGLYEGWFYDYPVNKFLKDYRKRKDERNKYKNARLKENYGSADSISLAEVTRRLGCVELTTKKHLKLLDNKGLIKLSDHRTASGRYKIPPEWEGLLKESMKNEG